MRAKVAVSVPEAVREIADWATQEPDGALLVCRSPQYQRMQMALAQFTAASARYEALQRRQEKFEAKLAGRSAASTTAGGFLGSSYGGNLSGAAEGGGLSLTAVKFKRTSLVTLPPTEPANDNSGVGVGISLVKWKRPGATGGAAAVPKAAPGAFAKAPAAFAPAQAAAADPQPVEADEPEASSAEGSSDDEFFHGGIKKAAADELLLADGGESETGKFLIRSKGDSTTSYFVSVIYKGAPTHHSLVREDEGSEFTLNKQPSGQTTFAGVIQHYAKKRPKWPVPLTTGVPADGAKAKSKSAPTSAPAAKEAPAAAAPAPAPAGNGASQFLHNIKKPESEELLLADGGEDAAGKFLIRRKGTSENDFFISVIYKGKPTHHALSREDEGSEFTLNKNPTGQMTLEDCVEHFRSKRPKWPVPLTEGVPSSGGGGGGGSAAKPAAKPAAKAAPSKGSSGGGGKQPWLHNIKKPESEELLLADGGEDAAGKFLIRRKGTSENDFFISVIYKGKPTHHALSREDEGSEFTLNKNPTGQMTLEDCVEHFRSKRPKWPVPLKDHVPA